MTSPYIVYNGVDSREMGVLIEQLPDLHRPPRNVALTQVPGANGRAVRDDGTYDLYTTSMTVNCFGVPLRNVYAWLTGEGWLMTSDEPNRRIYVQMHSQIKDTRHRFAGECYDSLLLTLYCQPYRYFSPDADAVTLDESPGQVDNPGTAPSQPRIIVTGTGDISLMIGGTQLDFEGLEDGIVVDSEAMECYTLDFSGLLNRKADIDDFPVLQPGVNYVQWTGAVTSIVFERRCRDL